MAYRIVEITNPSEVHVMNHQLLIEQEEAKFSIPLEDIEIILCAWKIQRKTVSNIKT